MIKSNLQGILVFLVSIALVACSSGDDNVLSNDAPTASEVRIIDNNGGNVVVGDTLTGSYIYADVEGNAEARSSYRWLRNGIPIGGATNISYTLVADDGGASITFEVIPVAELGTTTGDVVISSAIAVLSNNSPPTASDVVITDTNGGSILVSDSLVGNYTYADLEGDTEGATTFRWLRNGVAISGATNSTYTLVAADSAASVTFEVTPVAATGTATGNAVTSSAVAVLNFPPTASGVSITDTNGGDAVLGDSLTGNYNYADFDGDAEGATALRWLRNGTAISGATAATYALVVADIGQSIIFEVTPVAITGTIIGNTVTSGVLTVINSAPTASSVSINDSNGGSIVVGDVLNGSYNFVDLEGDIEGASTFRWLRNALPITGANASTYTLIAADSGQSITFEVTPVAQTGIGTGSAVTSNSITVANSTPTVSGVNITDDNGGSAVVGDSLTGNYIFNDADGDGDASTFRWLRNGAAISGATASTYILVAEDSDKSITIEVTPVDTAGSTGTAVISGVISGTNSAPTATAVSISDDNGGTAVVGDSLTGSYTYADVDGDAEGVSTFRWLRDGTTEVGTGVSYTLVAIDSGTNITFEVTPIAQTGVGAGSVALSNSITVVNSAPAVSGVSITDDNGGSTVVGDSLTGNYSFSDIDGDGDASTFRWLRGGNAITGATASSYTLVADDSGPLITFEVTPVDDNGTAGTVITSTPVTLTNSVPTVSGVSITDDNGGAAVVGDSLTGNYTFNDVDGDGDISTFLWLRNGSIVVGSSKTYTLVALDSGQAITFRVTPVADAGTNPGSAVDSTNTITVVNSAPEITSTPITTAIENATYSYTFTATDVDTDSLTYSNVSIPALPAWIDFVPATGILSGIPGNADVGSFGVVLRVNDGAVSVDQGFTITVSDVNNAGSVSISGTATEGQILSAVVTDADGVPVSIAYQWKANGVNIGTNTNTYVLTQAEVGRFITVTASYIDDGGTAEAPVSAATAAVTNVNNPGSVSISGAETEGQILSATVVDTDGVPATIVYQWKANGVNIGTDSATYLLTQAEVGQAITVTATYTDNQGGAEAPVSAATAAVTNVNNAGSVSISGNAGEGQTLTATVSDTDGLPATIAYQWKANGVNIGTDNATYLLTQAEVGQAITVTATYTDNQGGAEAPVSAATAAVTNVNNPGSISIGGTPTEGQTLTATVSDIDGVPATIAYQWKANGVNIGTNTNTYVLTQAEVGLAITVTATYTDNQGGAEAPVSAATAAVTNVNNPGGVSISGTASEGQTLAASVNDADGISGAITYVWKAGVTNIGTNSDTYVLTQAEVGQTITVTASYTDDGGTAEAPISPATAAVTNVNNAGSVSISGTASEGQTLAASVNDTDGISGAITYVWKAGVTNIGTNSDTYVLTQAEVGQTITVTAIYTDDGGTAENLVSAATAAVTNVNNAGSVSISGTASESQILIATVNDIDGVPASIAYQWKANGVNIGTNSNAYLLTQAEVGQTITVTATYTDNHGSAETPVSAATAAVTNVNNPGSVSISGAPTEGQILTASVIDTDGVPATIAYQWKANGATIGTNSNTYVLTQAEVGQTITVTATYIDNQGGAEAPVSIPTAAVTNVNNTGSVSITGITSEGQTLAANVSDVDGVSGAITYEWKAGVTIIGTNSNTYILTQAEVGQTITVTASYIDDGGTAEAPVSAATAAVTNVNNPGSVSISGAETEGQILSATVVDTDGVPATIVYQWKANGVNIGADSATYLLTQAEVGQAITVTATYTDNQGGAEAPVSAATAAVTNVNNPGSVSISGTPTEGQILTATVTDTDGVPATIAYQWKANGVNIGTDSATYLLTQAEVGQAITVTATYTDNQGGAEAPVSAATAAVTNVNNPGSVSISGTPTEGQTLTATVSDVDGVPVTIAYQWRANGVNIGANANTYVLTQAEVSQVITVTATYIDNQGGAEAPVSAATAAVTNVNNPGSVSISGAASEGQTLTASVSDIDGVSATIAYQWKANGVNIGMDSNTYVLTQAEVDQTITVTASYTDDGGTAEVPVSTPTAVVTNVNNPGSVSIGGAPTEGQALTATVTDTDGVPATIVHQWQADGVNIGADSATYLLTQAEVGKTITVTATYTDSQGGAEAPVSVATAAVANLPNAGSVSIGGTPTEGQTLTATVSDDDGVPAIIVYQWQADGANIGTDSATYLLTQVEVGKTITVTATYTDSQGGAEAPVSAATAAVANLPNAGSVSIGGTPTEGQTLTATVSDDDGVPVTIAYQWKAGVTNIGTNSNTYVLTQSEVGQTITVTATYIDNQGGAEAPTSSPTAVVTDTAPVVSGLARYLDINMNAINDVNDQLIIPFDQVVITNTVISSDFNLPVSGDTFGTGATVSAGPAGNEVTITLGTSPNFKTGGDFSIAVTTAGSPSGVDVSGLMMAEAIENTGGVDAVQSVPVDLIPAFVDSAQALGGNDSRSVALADVDGANGLDIVVANGGTQPNQVYLNNGSGSFANSNQSLGGNDSQSIVLGDVNGDGDLDIVVANASAQGNRVYINDILNDGSIGVFTDSGQSLGTGNTQSIVLGDVNGDGDLDIVVANVSAQGNRVYINDILNDGSIGVFTDSGQSLGTSNTQSIVLGDVDGVNGLDIVVANGGTQPDQVYLNNGSGSFANSNQSLGSHDSQSIVLGDVNGDGDLDIVVANASGEGNQVYINDINDDGSTGVFSVFGPSLGTNDSQSVVLGDVDGDTDLDMVVANTGLSNQNRVYLNDGAGNFTDSGQSLGTNDSQSVILGDVDGDADLDAVVVNSGTQVNRVYLGSLSGT